MTLTILLTILIAFCGWAAFTGLAAAVRPQRRPLLQCRPEYRARHRRVQIGV